MPSSSKQSPAVKTPVQPSISTGFKKTQRTVGTTLDAAQLKQVGGGSSSNTQTPVRCWT